LISLNHQLRWQVFALYFSRFHYIEWQGLALIACGLRVCLGVKQDNNLSFDNINPLNCQERTNRTEQDIGLLTIPVHMAGGQSGHTKFATLSNMPQVSSTLTKSGNQMFGKSVITKDSLVHPNNHLLDKAPKVPFPARWPLEWQKEGFCPSLWRLLDKAPKVPLPARWPLVWQNLECYRHERINPFRWY